MQVPTVTLEDLQSFQATHFPGRHNPLTAPAPSATEANAYDADDDLGYYPDGVKRTLTDEQIKIFRHSEIHALLRARQLERDEAEYEARMAGSGGEGEDVSVKMAGESAGGALSSAGGNSKSKKRNRNKRQAEEMPSEPLDYSDQPEGSGSGKQARTGVQQYPGRRIVSYAEE